VEKTKAAGKTEDVKENDEADEAAASGMSTDYNYLLGMAIWSLTKD
jgi:DNA topoisomerase-2